MLANEGNIKILMHSIIARYFTLFSAIVFLVLGIFFCAPRQTIEMEQAYEFTEGCAVEQAVTYSSISLRPDIYRIQLEYKTNIDYESYCTVRDDTVIRGGLLVNHEHFYSQLGRTDYHVWLFEKADNLEVIVNYNGKGQLTIGKLVIVGTGLLWTMLMVCEAAVWIVVMALILLYERNKRGLVPKERKEICFWLAVIALLASVPFLYDDTWLGADLVYHMQRIEGVKDGLLSGQFPVRLEPRWLFDHGYADGVFYCNAFLYFPALLRMAGFPIFFCYNAYCIAVNILTILISYYCFSRMFRNGRIGCICTATYTLCILRVYNLVVTSAVGEGTALTFLPLVLYGFYRVLTEDTAKKEYRSAWLPIALGMTGLIHCHVLSCEITVLVILFLCILYFRRIFEPRRVIALLTATFLSLLVSLWYLIPFLDYYFTQDFHIKNVSARTIQIAGLLMRQLLFQFWIEGEYTSLDRMGMYGSHSVGVGFSLSVCAMFFGTLWFSGRLQEKDERTQFVKKVFAIGMILLLFSLGIFPWDRIQRLHPILASLISSLQFPNRFLGWGSLCLVVSLGYGLYYFEKENKILYWVLVMIAVLGTITSGIYLLDHINCSGTKVKIYDNGGIGYGYISGAEYKIEGTDHEILTFSNPVASEGIEIDEYQKKPLGGRIVCRNTTDSIGFVELPLLLYKGYFAVDENTGSKMKLSYGSNMEVCLELPAGYDGCVEVAFEPPIYWRIAELISLVTVMSVLLLFWRIQKRNGSGL